MGNIFGTKKTSCNNTNDPANDLTPNEYDKAIYNERAEKVHKGTIAVAILYGSIALLLLLGSYLFDSFKVLLFNRFFIFTLIYIIGTILLISFLMYSVLNYKPIKIKRTYDYDYYSCPDYWTLEKIPLDNGNQSEYYQAFDTNNLSGNLFNYRCVMNPKIFSKLAIQQNNNSTNEKGFLYISNNSSANNSPPANLEQNDYTTTYKTDDYTKQLFANLKDTTNVDLYKYLSGNVLDTSNIIKYELTKNALIMNNYEIIPTETTDQYTTFRSKLQDSEILQDVNNDRYKINKIDFDYNTTDGVNTLASGAFTSIGNNNIRVFKNGDLKIKTSSTSDYDQHIKTLPLVCDRFYPLVLANKDTELAKNNLKLDNNILRCAYSKMCKVPWSDMNCDKYNDLI